MDIALPMYCLPLEHSWHCARALFQMSLCCCLNRQDLILQHSHASHPVVLCAQPYLPCGFCQDHSLVVWLWAQSDHLSRRRGGEGSGFDMLLEEAHVQMCFEIFVLLACSILSRCCVLWNIFPLCCLTFPVVERLFHFQSGFVHFVCAAGRSYQHPLFIDI